MVNYTDNQLFTQLHNGVDMPLLGLGVYDMYNKEAEQAVAWALEIGYRLIDTASMYKNETEIGNSLRDSGLLRGQVFVTTKVNNADQGYDATLRAFDVSLEKLGIDYLDLYLIHWPIKATRKDTWRALEHLYEQGRLRAIGVANYTEPFLDEMATYLTVVPMVNQVEFSPYLFLEPLLEKCRAQQTVLQAYTPLMRGQKMQDPKLVALAEQYNKTPAQIILRWALQLGVSTIPKSANLARLKENFDVFDFEISEVDLQKIASFDEGLRLVDDPIGYL